MTDSPDLADFELALLTDIGCERSNNEDFCGHRIESPREVVFAVADGVGGYDGGEVASQMAVDVTLATYHQSAASIGPAKRLYRAVQRANIEIHNRALAVPELRRMATTLTAVAVADGILYAVHIGDCRLYLIRGGRIQQMTKDHTVIGERVRLGLISEKEARNHPDRSALSRCLGRELIASLDRITMPLRAQDRVIVCTDGLHGTLENRELDQFSRNLTPADACRRFIEAATTRGAADNVTTAVLIVHNGSTAADSNASGWRGRLLSLLRMGR
ncbi:MAG TPA: protein phosphatase 2C domain-containing protein [Candidatus Binataceae bacterium]